MPGDESSVEPFSVSFSSAVGFRFPSMIVYGKPSTIAVFHIRYVHPSGELTRTAAGALSQPRPRLLTQPPAWFKSLLLPGR